ncbi:Urease accessory protein UreF [compost metagenome]
MDAVLTRLRFAQLLDSALPVGGFSHSFGLETYVEEKDIVTGDQLEQYISGQLQCNWVRMEGLVIKGVFEALERKDASEIARLDQIVHVQRVARESRDGLQKMGKRLLKLSRSLYPELSFHLIEEAIGQHDAPCTFPVIFAWISRALGVSRDESVCGYMYISVMSTANGGLRLMHIGQTEVQTIVTRALEKVNSEWEAIKDWPVEKMCSFGWAQEIYAMRHETLGSRLFMS